MKLWQRTPSFVYRVWRHLPGRAQCLLLYIGAPKVTMGAAAVITDRHGRVLLARHTYRTHRPWALPGGLVGHHEQPDEGLARELREELNVEATIGPPLFAETDTGTRHHTLYYRATIQSLPRCNGTEVDEYRFVSLEDLPSLTGEPAPPWLWAALGRMPAVA